MKIEKSVSIDRHNRKFKFVREAKAIKFVLFSAPGKGKSHVNRNIEISL